MTAYIHAPTGDYPLTWDEVTARIPEGSFPAHRTDFSAWGFYRVHDHPQPFPDVGQRVVEGAPVKDGAVWRQTWKVETLSPDEKVEQERAALEAEIAECECSLPTYLEPVIEWLMASGLKEKDMPDGLRTLWQAKRIARDKLEGLA